MNNKKLAGILVIAVIGVSTAIRLFAAEPNVVGKYEYATIRWSGRDFSHIIRPGGQVEFVGHELKKANKPERADDRAFFMNVAMNGLVKEGYEFAGMNTDEIVMKRTVGK